MDAGLRRSHFNRRAGFRFALLDARLVVMGAQLFTRCSEPHHSTNLQIPSLIRVQRNSIALAVDNDGAKPEGSDRVFRLYDFAAVRRHRGDRVIESAVRV